MALGDARLALEREPPQHFDVLAVDAFSSDAIPVHLITSEAVGDLPQHLKPGGVIAFHVTNRFLNLIPVVEALARAHGLAVIHIRRRRRRLAGEPQRLGAAVDRRGAAGAARSSPMYAREIARAPRLAAVDRRLQQPGPGAEVGRRRATRPDATVDRTMPPTRPATRHLSRARAPAGARFIEVIDQRALPHVALTVQHRRRRRRGARDPRDVGPRRTADRRRRRLRPRARARPRRQRRRARRRRTRRSTRRGRPRSTCAGRSTACARRSRRCRPTRAPTPPGARPTRSPPRTSRSTTRSARTASRCCASIARRKRRARST